MNLQYLQVDFNFFLLCLYIIYSFFFNAEDLQGTRASSTEGYDSGVNGLEADGKCEKRFTANVLL